MSISVKITYPLQSRIAKMTIAARCALAIVTLPLTALLGVMCSVLLVAMAALMPIAAMAVGARSILRPTTTETAADD